MRSIWEIEYLIHFSTFCARMLNIFLDFYIKFTSAILTFAVYGTERNKHRRVATHIERMALPPVRLVNIVCTHWLQLVMEQLTSNQS